MTQQNAQQDALRELNGIAMQSMAAGDYLAAQVTLKKALGISRKNPSIWLNLAAACRVLSDIPGALAAVEGALQADPRSFMALLMKGSLLEQSGQLRSAAKFYGFAIGLAPAEETLDAPSAKALRHARKINAEYIEELVTFVREALGPSREPGSTGAALRLNAFMDHALRRKIVFRQEPSDFFYPGLPAIEFYEREEFPWLPALEAETQAIRRELMQILADDFRDFVPYVAYPDGLPLDQWAALNQSTRWGALHLYLAGKRVEKNAVRCPATMAAIATLPQPVMADRSPAAMFSALQPKTHIPPHNGVANTRLVLHLPLIVPEDCGFRVGHQIREWREGEAWVFDDTIEHEAWNRSDRPRTILICDVWNPRISLGERDAIVEVIHAMDRFHDVKPKSDI